MGKGKNWGVGGVGRTEAGRAFRRLLQQPSGKWEKMVAGPVSVFHFTALPFPRLLYCPSLRDNASLKHFLN